LMQRQALHQSVMLNKSAYPFESAVLAVFLQSKWPIYTGQKIL